MRSKTARDVTGASHRGLSSGLATLFAVTAGFSAANIYYAQPLLTAIADTFNASTGAVSLVVTAGTVGYTIGMALLVPLGDILDRRRLVMVLLCVVAASQTVAAASPALPVLIGAALVAAVGSIVSPLMVAFAATLASPEERGRVTGKVMSGVLLGVLLARTAGGAIAEWAGWRTVYALAALLIGIVVLDFGVQGMQVINLGVIYQLRPEARSRLTTAYMTIYFLGGTLGSAASGAAYAAWGWSGTCALGTVLAAVALLVWLREPKLREPRSARKEVR